MDTDEIKADYAELYRFLNGMSLQDMDKIRYPVYTLCRDHEKAGFAEGFKVGLQLYDEIR